jgi:predicted Zn-dependent protease
MLRRLVRVVPGRFKAAALLLALLVVAATPIALNAYAFHAWNVAQTAVKEGRPADARGSLDFCLFVWPRSAAVHLLSARAARLRGDFAGAETHLKEVRKLQNGPTEAYQLEYLLMRVQTGEADVVAPDLLRYVDHKDPETPVILETLARAFLDKLRYGPALLILDRWAKEEPDSPKPLQWRGWVEVRVDEPDPALKDFRRAVELDPDLVEARLQLVELLLEKNEPDEALPHLQRLSRQFPDRADVQSLLGQCRFLRGESAEARRLLEAARTRLPDDLPLLITLAKLDNQEGRPAEAEELLRRVLKADPLETEAQYTLVSSLQFQDRREEAAAALAECQKTKEMLQRVSRLLKQQASDPTNDPDEICEIGAFFLRSGQGRLAEYWLLQALQRNPKHRAALKALAEYYEGKGDAESAAAYRGRLAEADKKADAP